MSYRIYKIPREMPRHGRRATDQIELPESKASVFARLWRDVVAVWEMIFRGGKR